MGFVIHASHKAYTVSYHAARRMMQRYISEDMVIATLENGALNHQPQGLDVYRYLIDDDLLETTVMVRVVVNESTRMIVSVIDETGSVEDNDDDDEG
ncbi:MAG TPA: DUF4258 domain-containing protein [Phototrophicaceae bacterium]|jgi:hypothetical protein|nr:DUF4258 domain-containing protein [Phototrophicaceae bacterium]